MASIQSRYYKSGSLSRANEVRSYINVEKHVTTNRATPRVLSKVDQLITVVTDAEMSNGQFNFVLGYYVSWFYPLENYDNIQKERLLVSLAGIIANSLHWGNMRPWNRMTRAFGLAGINLQIDEKSFDAFKRDISEDSRFVKFLKLWTDDIQYVLQQSHMFFILSCVIMLSGFKYSHTSNFKGWITRRILRFSETVGDKFTPDNIDVGQYPDLSQLEILFSFMSASHFARKQIFLEIVPIAMAKVGFISAAFAEIHHMLRGHGMEHLILIDKYIFEENPELLDTSLLRGLKPRFATAIAKLREYDPSERLFVKILYDKDECSVVNREIFEEAAIVATTIARQKYSTFEN